MSGAEVSDAVEVLPQTSRLQSLRRLGTGGMGVVFEAQDLLRGTRVALKMIRRLSPEALLFFKTEFRVLQDLQHPNLVRLDELICDRNQWFFTMELVEGVNFLAYVGAGDAGCELALSHTLEDLAEGSDRALAATMSGGDVNPPAPAPTRRFDEIVLRSVLAQLVQGVVALHAAGKVHRDIKPSNILVTAAGRVVLLDFGAVADARRGADSRAIGTPLYMAPEQADGRPAGPPSDWYAVGLMLYQALTGRLPFGASPLEGLDLRRRLEPLPPQSLVAGLPEDLARLCMDLLRVEPGERPGDLEMLRRLSLPNIDTSPRERFVGRRRELDEIDAWFAAVQTGDARTLLIHGESGTGKTALMTRFLERLDPSVVVVAGRCCERESVPYKAVDEAVDALSWHLKRLPPSQAKALLPRHGAALAQLFPVLQRVPLVDDAMQDGGEPALEPYELRLHAFAALRELVANMARQHPLVLAIDDLQWADADSMALLEDLLAPPVPPGVFLLATVRPPSSAVADATVATLPGAHALRLTGLALDEARELADVLLSCTPTAADERARIAAVIASESHGHPLFIDELVRHKFALGLERETPRLEDALSARIQGLSREERCVLELLAIASAPVTQDVAAEATGIGFDELARRAASLRAVNLVRSAATTAGPALEPYHDRVRRSAIAGLAPDTLRELHGKLAEALEQRQADAELLALHFREAGEPRRAAVHAAVAATRAAAALAFERAAQLFRTAAAHEPPHTTQGQRLRIGLAEALANAGLCAEAARAFEDAAAATDPATAAQLEQRAAEQYLRAGHIDAGLAATSRVLALHGLALPRTPLRALFSLAIRRALLRMRGLRYRERTASEVPGNQLSRIDVCFSVSANLGVVDPVRGGVFQTRSLLWALRAGEPSRIARALAGEAGYAATRGVRGRPRADHLLDLAGQLARRIDDPRVLGLVHCFTGFTGYLTGDWHRAREHCERARAIWRGRCVGVSWELDANDLVQLSAMTYQGEIAELARRVVPLLRDAEARGDLYAVTSLRAVFVPLVHLAADQPHEARREGAQAIRAWSKTDFHIVHFNFEIVAQGYISLYLGEAESAYRRISRIWSAARTSLLRFVQHMRIVAVQMRALCALAAAARGRARTDWLRAAQRDVRRLTRENAPWARGWIDLLTAGLSYQRGDRDTAVTLLRDAVSHCETAGLHLHVAVARRRLGELLQGDEGRQLTIAADAWMSSQGVRAPRRWTASLAPGFSDD